MRPALFCLLLIAACSGPTTVDPSIPSDLTFGRVTWIVDGDTIEITVNSDELTVRILGINAPDQGECFNEDATNYLIDEIKDDPIGLDIRETDQFGRTLAHVWHEDRLIAYDMVADGLVIATTADGGDPHGARLLEAEESAFDAGNGLWSHTACGSGGDVPEIAMDVDFDPPGSDGEHLDRETITLVSDADQALDLTGWVIRDESSRHRFHFEHGTTLNEGESVVVRSSDRGWDPGGGPVWNNDGDMALLLDQDGRVVARLRYP